MAEDSPAEGYRDLRWEKLLPGFERINEESLVELRDRSLVLLDMYSGTSNGHLPYLTLQVIANLATLTTERDALQRRVERQATNNTEAHANMQRFEAERDAALAKVERLKTAIRDMLKEIEDKTPDAALSAIFRAQVIARKALEP